MSTRILNDIHNDLKQLIKVLTLYKVCLQLVVLILSHIFKLCSILQNINFYVFRKMKKDLEDVSDFVYQISNIIAIFLLTVMQLKKL